jgi:predicted house-cleaning NTP pyrophosphatase (Maf/HAM1 superfamily)
MDVLTTVYSEGLDPEDPNGSYNGNCVWTCPESYLARSRYISRYTNLFGCEKQELIEKRNNNTYRLIVLADTMCVFEQSTSHTKPQSENQNTSSLFSDI